MVVRDEPFKGMHPMQVARAVDRGERPPLPPSSANDACPPAFRDLIERCWQKAPTSRPSFVDVLQQLKDMARR